MKGRFSRTVLMIAGILTVVIILISQSFYQVAQHTAGKKSDKHAQKSNDQKSDKQVSIVTADVVPSHAVQLDKSTPAVIKTFTLEKRPAELFLPVTKIFTSFFRALLRAAISPNAP